MKVFFHYLGILIFSMLICALGFYWFVNVLSCSFFIQNYAELFDASNIMFDMNLYLSIFMAFTALCFMFYYLYLLLKRRTYAFQLCLFLSLNIFSFILFCVLSFTPFISKAGSCPNKNRLSELLSVKEKNKDLQRHSFGVFTEERIKVQGIDPAPIFKIKVLGNCNGDYDVPKISAVSAVLEGLVGININFPFFKFDIQGQNVKVLITENSVNINPDGSKTVSAKVEVTYQVNKKYSYILISECSEKGSGKAVVELNAIVRKN